MTDTIKDYSFRRAATIKVPDEFFNPLRTGMKDVDDSWSEIGGIVPSQVTFITGQPGSGKTTLTLAIGACLSKDKPVAFISLEMSDFQLAHQAKKIPGFGGVDVTGDFDQELTMQALRSLKPGLIILDSIQKAARKMKDENGKQMPFDRAQFTIVDMFTRYAKETWTPVFLIGHCDKSGNYKGPSDLLHDVDSHLLVNYDKEMDLRTFTFGKNRFGGMVQDSLFGITRDSVWVGSPYISTVFGEASVTPTQTIDNNTQAPAPPVGMVLNCITQLTTKWDGSTARATINAVTQFLKANDPEFKDRSFVKDSKRVKVQYRGNSVAHCHPRSGELVFGKKTFTKMEVGKIGYAKEQKYIHARNLDNAGLLVWVVVHEWMHLYDGLQHHKNEFFDEVAKKYDWLMAEVANEVTV
jgi:energy-coupling factor transporter ATP-binding protein EcfA2